MNLYLIGYRATGKSTVAPLLADKLGWTAIDSDAEVELLAGKSIAELFEEAGEAGFRQWETTVIQAISLKGKQIISLGGGAPTVAENRLLIKKYGVAVLLTASPEAIWQRLNDDANERPALTDLDGFSEVKKLLAQRDKAYRECADCTVDTADLPPEVVADRIAKWWNSVDR